MINISSTFRSPKKTKQEMLELLTIINVFKKNQKIYLKSNQAYTNIQYEEPSQIVTDLPPVKKSKQKSSSSELINLKAILENWQAKQLYIKDNIVSQNISKNLIIDSQLPKYYYGRKQKSNVTTSQKQYHSQRIVKPDLKLAPLKFKNIDHKPKSTLGSLTKKMFAPEPQVYMPPIKLPPIVIPKNLENSA